MVRKQTPLTKPLVCLAKSRNDLTQMLQSSKPRNQLVTKPCRPCEFVDAVKGQWMNCSPHIIPLIFVKRVVNEECVLNRGTTILQTIRMLKESVQGFDKKYGLSVTGAPVELQTTSHQSWSKVRHLWSCSVKLGVQTRLRDWNMDFRFF